MATLLARITLYVLGLLLLVFHARSFVVEQEPNYSIEGKPVFDLMQVDEAMSESDSRRYLVVEGIRKYYESGNPYAYEIEYRGTHQGKQVFTVIDVANRIMFIVLMILIGVGPLFLLFMHKFDVMSWASVVAACLVSTGYLLYYVGRYWWIGDNLLYDMLLMAAANSLSVLLVFASIKLVVTAIGPSKTSWSFKDWFRRLAEAVRNRPNSGSKNWRTKKEKS